MYSHVIIWDHSHATNGLWLKEEKNEVKLIEIQLIKFAFQYIPYNS